MEAGDDHVASDRQSFCEWKGVASYLHVLAGDGLRRDVAWTYEAPTATFAALALHVAFYAASMDRCLVDGEIARPQPGGFYGGWMTNDVVGPFKGAPGTSGW
jgi:nucleotidyltransferase-like protein